MSIENAANQDIENQHNRMISEGSCDTEYLSNEFNFAITGINYILTYIKIEDNYFVL